MGWCVLVVDMEMIQWLLRNRAPGIGFRRRHLPPLQSTLSAGLILSEAEVRTEFRGKGGAANSGDPPGILPPPIPEQDCPCFGVEKLFALSSACEEEWLIKAGDVKLHHSTF